MNLFNKKKKNQKGFTLVELLVVIAIIGILAAVITPNIFAQIEKSKTSAVVSEYRAAKTAALLLSSDSNATSVADLDDLTEYLEKALDNAPFGGTYSSVGSDVNANKFLAVPNVPQRAALTITNTLTGTSTLEAGAGAGGAPGASNPNDIYVSSTTATTVTLYLRLLP